MTLPPKMRRRNGGKDLFDALYYNDVSRADLAKRTRDVDPSGRGISPQLVGFLLSRRTWGRDTTSTRSAALIEKALGAEPGSLFEQVNDAGMD